MTNALATLGGKLACRFGMDEQSDVVPILKATAFKGQASDAQLVALLIVADQYGLNPFTKEIYAFPDQNNGIVPVVGVDGWSRIMNSHPQFDGMDFIQDEDSCTCVIYRKDRGHPIKVTEYMSECKRGVKPWQSHPKRMLRHKAMIQCARLAFGYVGIYDTDEAERIMESAPEKNMGSADVVQREAPELPECTPEIFADKTPEWRQIVSANRKTPEELIAMLSTRAVFSDEQKSTIRSWAAPAAAEEPQPE